MWPDRVSNPGPLTYESGALPIALRGPPYTCSRRFVHRPDIVCSTVNSRYLDFGYLD